jgi:hypothetical protein
MEARMDLTGAEREGYSRDYMLSTDTKGREIFVGLDVDESEWLLAYRRDTALGQPRHVRSVADKARHVALSEKSGQARLAVIGALVHRDTVDPSLH